MNKKISIFTTNFLAHLDPSTFMTEHPFNRQRVGMLQSIFSMRTLWFTVGIALLPHVLEATASMPWSIISFGNSSSTKLPGKRFDLRLQELEKQREKLKTFFHEQDMQPLLEKTSLEIEALKRKLSGASDIRQLFWERQLSALSQKYQVLTELEQAQHQLINTLETQIKKLQEYTSDENFEGLKVPIKSQYEFEDIQSVAQKIVEVKTRLAELEKNKIAVVDDINKRKKAFVLIQEEYREKKKQQETFASLGEAKTEKNISSTQRGQLLDLEAQLVEYKKKLAELKINEAEQRLSLIEDFIWIDKAQLALLRKEYRRVQGSTHISSAQIKKVETNLDSKRQAFVAATDRLNDKMRILSSSSLDAQQKIQDTQQSLDISASDIAAIRDLDKEPKNSKEWTSFAKVLDLLSNRAVLDVERDLITVQMDLERAQFNKEELEFSIIRTWRKMTSDSDAFHSDEEVDQEIKMYALEKAEFEAHIVALTNGRDAAIHALQKDASYERIKQFIKRLNSQQKSIFKNRSDYDSVIQKIHDVEAKKRKRLDWLAKLIEAYSTTIAAVQNNVKRIDSIINELKAKSFWHRSDQSIRWNELSKFIPEIKIFMRDVKNAAIQFASPQKRFAQFVEFFTGLQQESLKALMLLINIISIVVLYFLLKLYLPDIVNSLQSVGRSYAIVRYICFLTAAGVQFFAYHLLGLYLWSVGFLIIYTRILHDVFLSQLFYLVSIPYLLIVAKHFFEYIAQVNRLQRFMFVGETYEKQFSWIVSNVTYAIIVLLLFRQAYDLGGYRTSQVSNVLMAILFLLLQIALISLIRRDQVLHALQGDTPLWEWVYDHVSKYYYFVWIAVIGIIVVSNPYIGYGRQIIYIFSRTLLTVALIPLFSWIHNRVKRASMDLFFYYTDTDEIKERFVAGRAWYGIFIITSLLLFLILGIYFGARIWGSRLSLRDMSSWLNYSFYSLFDEAGHETSVTIASLLQIIVYILGGIIVATIINKFILRRALDPFLVEPGIQNTVLTLIRSIIIIIAVFMGLSSAGLEGLLTKLAILLAGIGFAAQEAVRDFFSYFILLVQRPIKIGDLIEVTDTGRDPANALIGVVRHITPRSIMIRQRNSVTVIIPNSRVVMQPVINWSYSRSFIAFNDMFLTIPFASDPNFVRQLMLSVLDKNINLLKTPAPIVRLEDFTDTGYRFLIRGFLTSDKVLDQWDIASDVRLELVKQLRAHGIEVASPVRTLKVLSTDSQWLPKSDKEAY